MQASRLLGTVLSWTVKALLVVLMVAVPLLGMWFASSLASYANHSRALVFVAGFVLFPVVPLAWEAVAEVRRRRKQKAGAKEAARILTTFDRIILRTLFVNGAFVCILLVTSPAATFRAIATRGDWMLGSAESPLAQKAQRVLFAAASGLEWLYSRTRDNPYRAEGNESEVGAESSAAPPSSVQDASAPIVPAKTATAAADSDGGTHDAAPTGVALAATDGGVASPETRPVAAASTAHPASGTELKWPVVRQVHPLVANTPPQHEASIATLGTYLRDNEPDIMHRAKAIHDWVAVRISYDHPSAKDAKKRAPQDANTVFRTRKAVCAGYARLMVALGRASGVDYQYLSGDVRQEGDEVNGAPHAWNGLVVNNQRYLVDATWDSENGLEGYKTDYFLVPPDILLATHYPDNSSWQLMDRPRDRGTFFRTPLLQPRFFMMGLELVEPERSQIEVSSPSVTIRVKRPSTIALSVDVRTAGSSTRKECHPSGFETVAYTCELPGPGRHDVNMFANNPATDGDAYKWVGTVKVNVRP